MVNAVLVIIPVAVVLVISAILLLWWFKRKRKEGKEVEIPVPQPVQVNPEAMEAAAAFMVGDEPLSVPEVREDPLISQKVYQPASLIIPSDEPILSEISEDTSRYQGHEVEYKELPTPVEEEIDVSWIDLDVKRDLKHILMELDRKNVNCYQILNIPKSAEKKDIQKAYRKLAPMYHPDKRPLIGNMNTDEIMERIREINYSKEILLDPTMRALHDQMIREKEKGESYVEEKEDEGFDPAVLGLFLETREEEGPVNKPTIAILEDDGKKKNIGVLFFRKWGEDSEHFSQQFLDYIVSLDDEGYLNYGEVLMGDLTDIDEISRLKKVSNFSQTVNNALFDVWVRPPFYYMAVPVLSREYVQEICDMLKDSFNVESLFFTYPVL